ncbi:hypothetical protein MKR81_26635 (plasmid) [Vibrio campbellii]|uniref:hypothetical protein n=1 Tax=Vibrio campbellii TaxID=680 RepID=UPI001F0856E3|nr:hypothetical protein [Vibrio campbellii]UMM06841.1 hypothetical protein MKR81_26635 [Vibrio campbellii]
MANNVVSELSVEEKVKTVELCLKNKFPLSSIKTDFKHAFTEAESLQLLTFAKSFLNEDLYKYQLQHPSMFVPQRKYDPVVHYLDLFNLNPRFFLSEHFLKSVVLNTTLLNVFRDDAARYSSIIPSCSMSIEAAAVIYPKLLWDFFRAKELHEILKSESAIAELCKFVQAKPKTLLNNAFLAYYSVTERDRMEEMTKELTERITLFEDVKEWQ